MYSSSYKHRSATVSAFEDAYAKEAFLKRSASHDNRYGCTPYSENVCKKSEGCNERENETESQKLCPSKAESKEKSPLLPYKPNENSGLLSGMDGGDILLVLLIVFFLIDHDTENDMLIPLLLALVLLF